MRVVVTRPESEARRWIDDLGRRGFDVLALPLIAIAPAADTEPLRLAWRELAGFRAAMFVSGNAVQQFFLQRPAGAQWPAGTRAWAPGLGTRAALLEAGVPAALIDTPPAESAQFDSETLWQAVAMQVVPGDRVLIVRGGDAQSASKGRDWLGEQLAAAGALVETVAAYLRLPPSLDAPLSAQAREAASDGSVWLFSSSQAIVFLGQALPGQDWSAARAVATHPRIAQAARALGFGVVCESRPSLDAIVAALESIR
ncbi:MAG: uroporphyrinogen-III synthase [Ramlibacter sp.]